MCGIMSGLKLSLVLVMFLVLASQFFISETFAEASKDVAASALTDAEGVILRKRRRTFLSEKLSPIQNALNLHQQQLHFVFHV